MEGASRFFENGRNLLGKFFAAASSSKMRTGNPPVMKAKWGMGGCAAGMSGIAGPDKGGE
ncbi:hypothetical protein [Caldibacillus debilis]|uniref:Uncharacterized protein n=1 Tax=Caldibacillus debilis TaxID=301148 RepID=A0A150MDX7_9BACI|nr:hypothetical protein [Caldibacillus debilis]KYD22656.1 hypothetical protein B4135_1139 [Caldibacillus debilis]